MQLITGAIKARYAELWRIEHGFRVLKSDLRMRPIFHWKEKRIKAHVAICFSAYVLLAHSHYRVNLSAGDLERMSPAAILDHLSAVQVKVVTSSWCLPRPRASSRRFTLLLAPSWCARLHCVKELDLGRI